VVWSRCGIADDLLDRLRTRAAVEADYTAAVRRATSTTRGSTVSSRTTASRSASPVAAL
jgi:hypothetical protein